MTAPMDQASELMFWSDPGVFIGGFNLADIRQLGGHIRPLMAHAFGVNWTVADQLKGQHDLVGIALKSSPGVDYETYMTSRQVREHMQDQNFDARPDFGPLSPIEPVSGTGERPQPRRFPYPVC